MKRFMCLILVALLLAGVGSVRQAKAESMRESLSPVKNDPTSVPYLPEDDPTMEPTMEATPEPTPTPTPVPTRAPEGTPFQTRAPKEGDVATDRFPNYDTGADAEYSYQSDELRIAIKVIRDTEAHQRIFVADIWIRNLKNFRTGFAHGRYQAGTEDGTEFANRENAILAVNGNYAIGRLSVHDGKSYGAIKNIKGWHRSGFCGLYSDGTIRTFDTAKDKISIKSEIANGLVHGWQFGPILVKDGEKTTKHFDDTRHPRCMLGYYEPGHYVFVTCDGRRENAVGMSIDDMREFMYNLGVKEAFNLDGCYSAVMVFMGTVINIPAWTRLKSDGSNAMGRPINDMLMLSEFDENGEIIPLSALQPDKFAPVETE